MKKIIEEVLQAEEKVGTILKQARERASEIGRSAEQEISEKMSIARQQTLDVMKNAVEDGKKEGECVRDEILGQADLEKDALLKNNNGAIDGLVDNICGIILTTEYERQTE